MLSVQFGCVLIVVALCGMVQAQTCYGRVRTVVPVGPPPCGCGNDDISALLQLVRALNDDGSSNTGLNVDDLIMKLVNALIYTTTQGGAGGGGGAGGLGGSGGSGRGNNGNALIDLGLLGQNSNGGLDLANLGLGGTNLLNLGLGGIL